MHMFRSFVLLCAAVPVFSQVPADPDRVLFDLGTRAEAAGRLERAKLTLVTLASTYTGSPLADKARAELGAIYMFLEAQDKVRSGETQAAYETFRTLMRVYPESPLAKRADETSKSLGIPADPRR